MKKLIWIVLIAIAAEAHAVNDSHASTFGYIDLLSWQVRESGAENWAQTISPAGTERTVQLIDAPFNWNTGIRVGIGHVFNYDGYDISLTYTHYQTTATNQASGYVYSSFDANYFVNNTNGANFGPTYSSADIRWQFLYNSIDLNLGHDFKIDSVLQAHPHLGLKAASINQNIDSNWQDPIPSTNFTVATETLENDFSGLGPTIGVDTTWPIYTGPCQSFALIGNIDGGLLWGHWHFNDVYNNNIPVTVTTHVSSVNGVAPMIAGVLGLQWTKQFAKSDISIRLAYEEQLWFNQVQFYSLSMGRINRPVSLQGGNLEFRYTLK